MSAKWCSCLILQNRRSSDCRETISHPPLQRYRWRTDSSSSLSTSSNDKIMFADFRHLTNDVGNISSCSYLRLLKSFSFLVLEEELWYSFMLFIKGFRGILCILEFLSWCNNLIIIVAGKSRRFLFTARDNVKMIFSPFASCLFLLGEELIRVLRLLSPR